MSGDLAVVQYLVDHGADDFAHALKGTVGYPMIAEYLMMKMKQ